MNTVMISTARLKKSVLSLFPSATIEVWPDANILAIELSKKASLDFEQYNPTFSDEAGRDFLKKHEIICMYLVTFVPQAYQEALPFFNHICKELGGFFCADTEDFCPIIS